MRYSENYNMFLPDYGDPSLVDNINNNTETIDGLIHDNRTMIAPAYDTAVSYAVGDIVEHLGKVYKCTGATTGVWDATKWTQTTLADEIEEGAGGASALADLTDVEITSPTEGQALLFDDSDDTWKNQTIPKVEANPSASATDDLEKLKVGDTVYAIPGPSVSAEATGNPIELTDAADAPLVKCVTQITGSQDLHGQDKPWPPGAGKNKYNYETRVDNYYIRNDGEIRAATGSCYSALIPASGTVTLSGHTAEGGVKRIIEYDENGNFLRLGNYVETTANTDYSVSATVGENTVAVRISLLMSDTNVQLESGSTATAYEPYSNICPITAYTEGEVVCEYSRNIIDVQTAKYGSRITLNPDDSFSAPVDDSAWGYSSTNFRGTLPAGTYTASLKTITPTSNVSAGYGIYKSNNIAIQVYYNQTISKMNTYAPASITFTLDEETRIGVMFKTGSGVFKLMIERDDIAHDYESYIAPTTHTTTYPSAIYRGSEDVVNGEVTSDMPVVDLGDFTWVKEAASGSLYRFTTTGLNTVIKKATAYTEIPNLYCEWYSPISPNASYLGSATGITVDLGGKLIIFDSTQQETTAADFKTYVTGVKLAYELATPTTSSVTPTNLPIRTLSGYNYIWTDADSMEIEYITKPYEPVIEATNISIEEHGKTIESIITDNLEPHMVASRNYTIGELIISGDKAYRVTANIASGATLTVNTNVVATTIEEEIGRSGHVYSTAEQVVGTWIDGSTLYQRTYTKSVLPQSSVKLAEGVNYAFLVSSSYADGTNTISPHYIASGVTTECYISVDDSTHDMLLNNLHASATVTWTVTVRYTKTS